jgi:hypothetical protein
MRKEISLDEMRERVAGLIFGDDWIGSLTDEQYELLRLHPLQPRKIQRADGSCTRLDHVERLPARLAAKIDQARGKETRLQAQFVTVDSWLQDHGYSFDQRRSVDHQSFIALIRSEASKQKKAATPARRLTGPKPKIEPRIIADMDRDIAEGSLTREALEAMLEKELADRYQAKRERVRAARLKVLNGHG